MATQRTTTKPEKVELTPEGAFCVINAKMMELRLMPRVCLSVKGRDGTRYCANVVGSQNRVIQLTIERPGAHAVQSEYQKLTGEVPQLKSDVRENRGDVALLERKETRMSELSALLREPSQETVNIPLDAEITVLP